MPGTIDIDEFLDCRADAAVIDARSPSEFQQGHIPSASNLPLFDDQERAEIGSLYKQSGRQPAVLRGLERVGPKMRGLVEHAIQLAGGRPILLHCWRGGMRSTSLGWLLEQAGLSVRLLSGGYKSFRRRAQETFAAERPMIVLSGMTGAGKTRFLHEIRAAGEQVVDLENLAHHRGSSFGGIGLPPQPTCEQFQNRLFLALHDFDSQRPVWLEDESPSIGKVRVPDELWWNMRQSPAIFLNVDRETRAHNLVEEYAGLNTQQLLAATERLRKRLGGLRTQETTELIETGDYFGATMRLLDYYDKTYQHAASRKPRQHVYSLEGTITAERIVEFGRSLENVCGS